MIYKLENILESLKKREFYLLLGFSFLFIIFLFHFFALESLNEKIATKARENYKLKSSLKIKEEKSDEEEISYEELLSQNKLLKKELKKEKAFEEKLVRNNYLLFMQELKKLLESKEIKNILIKKQSKNTKNALAYILDLSFSSDFNKLKEILSSLQKSPLPIFVSKINIEKNKLLLNINLEIIFLSKQDFS